MTPKSAPLIVFAGLPASGKSTLAGSLAGRLGAAVLSKDRIRAALFPPEDIEYTRTQDDYVMQVVYRTAAYLLAKKPDRPVIVDGRPYVIAYQVRDLLDFVSREALSYCLIECTCSEESARERIEADARAQRHPASDRSFELYTTLKARSDPIPPPKLVVDTDQSHEYCLDQCIHYIKNR